MFKDLSPEDQKEYAEFVRESVASGSYFEDALDWYVFRYVNPVCERAILFLLALICSFITYVLYTVVIGALPIVEKRPVIIEARDPQYFPVILPLKPKFNDGTVRTVDETLAKYVITQYVKEREEYDFRNADIDELNNKINRIRNNSSVQEYYNFKSKMSKTNPESPILNFGKDIYRSIVIDSFSFKRNQVHNFVDKARDFMSIEMPTVAEVRYTAVINQEEAKLSSEKFLAVVSFKFSGVDDVKASKNLGFLVNDYRIYKVK